MAVAYGCRTPAGDQHFRSDPTVIATPRTRGIANPDDTTLTTQRCDSLLLWFSLLNFRVAHSRRGECAAHRTFKPQKQNTKKKIKDKARAGRPPTQDYLRWLVLMMYNVVDSNKEGICPSRKTLIY